MNTVIKAFVGCLLILAAFALFCWVALADEPECYECLTRAIPASRAGEIVVCKPAGQGWGKKELQSPFQVRQLCNITAAQAAALSAPAYNEDGSTRFSHRFILWVIDDESFLADQVSGQAITPAEVLQAVEADKLETKSMRLDP